MSNKFLEFSSDDFARSGLKKDPANWENGLRTRQHRYSFERWNLNACFEDECFVCASFSTGRIPDLIPFPNPTVSIDAVLPDGSVIHREFSEGIGKSINASIDFCDVNISGSYLRQSGNKYYLYYVDEALEISAEITPQTNMWRPGTGRINFTERGMHANWLVAVPYADITAKIRCSSGNMILRGTAYIDHIWSDCNIGKYVDHCYLCVGSAGDYCVIGADVLIRQEYGGRRISMLYASKKGNIILDGSGDCSVERSETFIHKDTHLFFDSKFDFFTNSDTSELYHAGFAYRNDVCIHTVPEPFNRVINFFGRNNTFLISKSDLDLSFSCDDGHQDFIGTGFMVQVSYTALPQAKPGELLGSEWPPIETSTDDDNPEVLR